jgi:hypothetical protein
MSPGSCESAGDAVITLWQRAVRLHRQMSLAYEHIGETRRERPGDDAALSAAQARADALGRRSEPRRLEGVLAKLRCAARCIRDTLPARTNPERTCDIELRFVFALERDVERLVRGRRIRLSRARRDGRGPRASTAYEPRRSESLSRG